MNPSAPRKTHEHQPTRPRRDAAPRSDDATSSRRASTLPWHCPRTRSPSSLTRFALLVAVTMALLMLRMGAGAEDRHSSSKRRSFLLSMMGVKSAAVRPRRNEPYLLEFHSIDCDQCEDMEPVLRRVERELHTKIERLEVYLHPVNWDLLQKLDKKARCGGLPYYYNRRTNKYICGATTYSNFKAFAEGKPSRANLAPPAKPEELQASGRKTGVVARFFKSVERVREAGQQRMKERLEAEIQREEQQRAKRTKGKAADSKKGNGGGAKAGRAANPTVGRAQRG